MPILPHRQEAYEAASRAVNEFIGENDEFAVCQDMDHLIQRQLEGWGSNFVIWGSHKGNPIVYKCFYEKHEGIARWNNEYATLRHFSDTGYVPEILGIIEHQLIAMTCLRGWAIVEDDEKAAPDLARKVRLGEEAGRAVGKLINTPPTHPEDGYSILRDYSVIVWQADVAKAVQFYLDICQGDRHLFASGSDPLYLTVLSFVEEQVAEIKHQRQVIYNDDLLCFVDTDSVQGFYDFELSRLGTEQMQLARVLRWCTPGGGIRWMDILRGYMEETGRTVSNEDYPSMLATNLLHSLVRIARWGKPDAKADYVAQYLPAMRNEVNRFCGLMDVQKWFPSPS